MTQSGKRASERSRALQADGTAPILHAKDDIAENNLTDAEVTLKTLKEKIEAEPSLPELNATVLALLDEVKKRQAEQATLKSDRARYVEFQRLRNEAELEFQANAAAGDYHQADERLEREPNAELRYALHVNRGLLRLEHRDFENATADQEAAIRLNERRLEAYAALALVCRKQNKPDDAVEQYRRAIAARAQSADDLNLSLAETAATAAAAAFLPGTGVTVGQGLSSQARGGGRRGSTIGLAGGDRRRRGPGGHRTVGTIRHRSRRGARTVPAREPQRGFQCAGSCRDE
jgi:tetratricopeptide (TPR) repeat protein